MGQFQVGDVVYRRCARYDRRALHPVTWRDNPGQVVKVHPRDDRVVFVVWRSNPKRTREYRETDLEGEHLLVRLARLVDENVEDD